MGRDLIISDKALIGDTVQNFTVTENDLRQVGSLIDTLVSTYDHNEMLEVVATIQLKLLQLQRSVNEFQEITSIYLEKFEPIAEDDEDDSV